MNAILQKHISTKLEVAIPPEDYEIFDKDMLDAVDLARKISDLWENPGGVIYFTKDGDFDVSIWEVKTIPWAPEYRWSCFVIGHLRDKGNWYNLPTVYPFLILPMGNIPDGFSVIKTTNDHYVFSVSASERSVQMGETVRLTIHLEDPQMNPRVGEPIMLRVEDPSGRVQRITETPLLTNASGDVSYDWEVGLSPGLYRIDAFWIFSDTGYTRSESGTHIMVSTVMPPDVAVVHIATSEIAAQPGDRIKVTATVSSGGISLPTSVPITFLVGGTQEQVKQTTIGEHGGRVEFHWDVESGLSFLEAHVAELPGEELTGNNSLTLPYMAGSSVPQTSTLRIFAASGMTSERIADAVVEVDGIFVGMTSVSEDIFYDVTAGQHLVEVSADGFLPWTKRVMAEPAMVERVDASMNSTLLADIVISPRSPKEGDDITLTSVSKGVIRNYRWYVDGAIVGNSFSTILDSLTAGAHQGRLEIDDNYAGSDSKSFTIPVSPRAPNWESCNGVDDDGDDMIDEGCAREESIPVFAPGQERELGGYLDDYQELAQDGNWRRFSTLDNSTRDRFSLGETVTVDLEALGLSSVANIDSMWVTFESMYGSGDVGTQPDPVSIWVDASQTGSQDGRILCRYAARGNAYVYTDSWGGWTSSSVDVPLWTVESDWRFTLNIAQKNRDGGDYTRARMRNIQLHISYPESLSVVKVEILHNGRRADTPVHLSVNEIVVLVENGEWSHSFATGESVILVVIVPEGLELEPGETATRTAIAGDTEVVTFRLQTAVPLSFELQVLILDEEKAMVEKEAVLSVNGVLVSVEDGTWSESYPESTRLFLELSPPSGYEIAEGFSETQDVLLTSDATVEFVLKAVPKGCGGDVAIRVQRATGGSKITAGKIAIRAGDSAEFAATVTDQEGNPVDEPIIWSVSRTAGTISSEGRFTASQEAGSAGSIIATGECASDTLQVTIIPNLLKRIELTPASVELKPGERVTFKAQGYDAYGNEINVRPLWHVTRDIGTISSITGTFVAGDTPGSGDVVAFAQAVFGDAATEVSGSAKVVVRVVPEAFALYANIPNPFNASTIIPYALPRLSVVRLAIYDLRGNLVCILVDGWKEAGRYQVVWNGRDRRGQEVSSGIYVVRLEAGERVKEVAFSQARRITLIR